MFVEAVSGKQRLRALRSTMAGTRPNVLYAARSEQDNYFKAFLTLSR
jgi:hypothetical protein